MSYSDTYGYGWMTGGGWGINHWLVFALMVGRDHLPDRAYFEAARVFAPLVDTSPRAGNKPDRIVGCGACDKFERSLEGPPESTQASISRRLLSISSENRTT